MYSMLNEIVYKRKYLWHKALAGSCNNLASTLFAVIIISPGLAIFFKPFNLQNIIALVESTILGTFLLTLSVYLDKK